MAPVNEWMSKVKEIQKSPLSSNFCFGFILFCLEKIVELEFACPCNPQWNALFASSFFLAPAGIAFLLMCIIQGCKCKEAFVHSAVPAILWPILLFFDGRYYACAKTSWLGKYELVEKAGSQRWCNPSNSTQNFLTLTQNWYSESQITGIWLALALTALYVSYLFFCTKNKTINEQEAGEASMRMTDTH